MDTQRPKTVSEELLTLHERAAQVAVAVNAEIAEADVVHPLAGGALYSIHAEAVAFHRAIWELCAVGFSSCVAPLLRTQLELLINALVITERAEDADYRGFRYSYIFLRRILRDEAADQPLREDARAQIDAAMARLPEADHDRAREFVYRERSRGYWYPPEYRRPQDAAEALMPEGYGEWHRLLSSAAHAGFVGLRFLKDAPSDVHPNPRFDSLSESFVLGASIRNLTETTGRRDQFENGGAKQEDYEAVLTQLAGCAPA